MALEPGDPTSTNHSEPEPAREATEALRAAILLEEMRNLQERAREIASRVGKLTEKSGELGEGEDSGLAQ